MGFHDIRDKVERRGDKNDNDINLFGADKIIMTDNALYVDLL